MRPVVYSATYECDIGPHVFPTIKYRLVLEQLLASGVVTRDQVLEPSPIIARRSSACTPRLRGRSAGAAIQSACCDPSCQSRPRSVMPQSWLPAAHCSPRDRHWRMAQRCTSAAGSITPCRIMPKASVRARCRGRDPRLQSEGRVERVEVVDTDVHQGNGTARIFQDDARVWTLSIHQENNYPIKERSDDHIGLDDGTGDEAYLAALRPA